MVNGSDQRLAHRVSPLGLTKHRAGYFRDLLLPCRAIYDLIIDPATKTMNRFIGHTQPSDDENSFLRDAVS
jgi:hypothetical protein